MDAISCDGAFLLVYCLYMIPAKVRKFLDAAKIKYKPLLHKTVYTAYDKAATLRVPEKQVAKTLVLKLDKGFAVAVIQACCNLDKAAFKKVVNVWQKKRGLRAVKNIDFVGEQWMKKNLKGTKVGAVPPFGVLWKLPTFADGRLLNNKEIILSAGTHEDSIKLTSAAYKRLLPDLVIGSFGKKR